MKEHSENFRLVLKITVISFLILFFAGSIYLWRATHLKSEARAISRYLISIKTTREETMSSHADEKFTQTESGPYGTTFTVENGIGKKNKDFFWISTEVYSSSLCEYLAKVKLGALKVDKSKCDTSNEVVFYFAKFKSKTKGSPDMDSQPKGCPKNAECDDQDNILSCNEGFYLSDDKCLKCPANSINCEYESFECQVGFYRSQGDCVRCGTGVMACNDNGEPTECMTDFYPMDGRCVPCSELGPGFCTNSSGASLPASSSVSSTYKPVPPPTRPVEKPIKTKTETLKTPECQDGYYRKGGSCVACPSYYKTCDKNTGYFTCQDGYVKNADRMACVKEESCSSKADNIRLSDSGIRVSVEGDTIVLSNNQTSQPAVISQDLDFSGCNVKINTASETHLLGNIYAKNLTISSPGNRIYTYRSSDVAPTISSGKKIVCSGDLKINGSFYSDRSVDVAGNLIITEFMQMTSSNVHIAGYVSGDSISTAKQVKTPITVEGYVSVSDLVHNVKSGDYINASVISAGEAENNIMVEQIALNGKLVSKNGDIIVTDSRKKDKNQDNLFTVHVDFGSELSVLNGSMSIVSGLDVLNLGNIHIARNLDVAISGIFRNWNQLYVGGSMTANTDIRLAGITHPNGNKINSQTLVCGSVFGSGKIQLNTVASLAVGSSISTSMKTQVIKYTGACEQGEGKLSAGRAAYYVQNYETYLNNGQCLLNKKSEEGSFSANTQDNCQNISWCQKNRYCN
ncbi:MAG: hypothetical protein E7021_01105 [Alphaproteobacteria bacterium]|nr:hypothetical protein [Alphaproteobacteria bacterium]